MMMTTPTTVRQIAVNCTSTQLRRQCRLMLSASALPHMAQGPHSFEPTWQYLWMVNHLGPTNLRLCATIVAVGDRSIHAITIRIPVGYRPTRATANPQTL